MASSKPPGFAATPSEDESAVQVQVLDSVEPLVLRDTPPLPSLSRVQVLDSDQPLVLDDPLSSVTGPRGAAGPSGASGPSGAAGPSSVAGPGGQGSGVSSSDEDYIPPPTGSSGRRVNYNADELRSLWCWQRLYKRLGTTEQCIQFAEERGLIPTQKMCSYHKRPMTLTTSEGAGHLGKFRCRKSHCRNRSISRATGTFFEAAKLPLPVIFQIMYGFSDQASYHQIQKEVAVDGPALSTESVRDWYNYCREAVVAYELDHQDETGTIGKPGEVVQIDESKFGKHKNKKGRHIEYSWRRKITIRHGDPFEELIKAVKYVHPL